MSLLTGTFKSNSINHKRILRSLALKTGLPKPITGCYIPIEKDETDLRWPYTHTHTKAGQQNFSLHLWTPMTSTEPGLSIGCLLTWSLSHTGVPFLPPEGCSQAGLSSTGAQSPSEPQGSSAQQAVSSFIAQLLVALLQEYVETREQFCWLLCCLGLFCEIRWAGPGRIFFSVGTSFLVHIFPEWGQCLNVILAAS